MKTPETPPPSAVVAAVELPAQSIRRYVEQLLVDEAEIDDLVEEILGACIGDFAVCDDEVPAQQWAMRVAARIVAERWRRSAPRLHVAG